MQNCHLWQRVNEFNRESGLYKKHKEVSSALAFIKGDKKGYSGVLNTNALNEMQENFYISLGGRINQKHFVIKRAFENVFDNVSERITLCCVSAMQNLLMRRHKRESM